jgi:hypothetical protein
MKMLSPGVSKQYTTSFSSVYGTYRKQAPGFVGAANIQAAVYGPIV